MTPIHFWQPSEWEQQRDNDYWERLCTMTPEEIDAELVKLGKDPEQVHRWAEEVGRKVREEIRRRLEK